jgi:D-alanyl-D-alanine carboxypeptidase (penicillin-binding protein 5/6)
MTLKSNAPRNNIAAVLLQSPHLVGITALILIGACGFVGAFVYFGSIVESTPDAVADTAKTDPFADIALQAKSVYVQDIVTGKVLFQRNADEQRPLASLTKVALALVVAESIPADTVITIPYDTAPRGAAERLAKGEKWKVSDVLSFTLTASSNEGADILAAAVDGAVRAKYPQASEGAAAIWRMNDLAHSLGLSTMNFYNDSGLDLDVQAGRAGAYASAHDVAVLYAYAASTTPSTFAGTTRDGILLTDENGNTASAFNTNEALGAIPGLIMGKTGYTDLAGGNLAVVFDVGLSHPVIAVVLGSTIDGRFSDMKQIVPAARKAVAQE